MSAWRRYCIGLVCGLSLSGCGGGGGDGSVPPGSNPATSRDVVLSWQANREAGINSPGGGYQVLVGGQVIKDVPYVSGPLAPTGTTIVLQSGTYAIAVRAYAALDPQGGNTGSLSAPSQVLTVKVP